MKRYKNKGKRKEPLKTFGKKGGRQYLGNVNFTNWQHEVGE
jgi:hypothetical protein